MKSSNILPILIFFFISCSNNEKSQILTNEDEENSNIAMDSSDMAEVELDADPIWYNNDTPLYEYCSQKIISQYEDEIELELEFSKAFRDKTIIACSMEEVQKYGSWNYTNSSMVFIPNGDSLIPVKLIPENLSENNPFQYENRVNGVLIRRTDLNLNGRPEYMFEFSEMRRTNFHSEINIYELDEDLQVLYPIDMSCRSDGLIGECDEFIGMEQKMEIHEYEDNFPIIIIRTTTSKCDESGSWEKLDEYKVNFQWSEEENKFKQV